MNTTNGNKTISYDDVKTLLTFVHFHYIDPLPKRKETFEYTATVRNFYRSDTVLNIEIKYVDIYKNVLKIWVMITQPYPIKISNNDTIVYMRTFNAYNGSRMVIDCSTIYEMSKKKANMLDIEMHYENGTFYGKYTEKE